MLDRLSDLAAEEIKVLEADGVCLAASDIIQINSLAHQVETPSTRISLARGRPIAVGGVYLWPLTLAASDWFQRIGGNLRGRKRQTLALAYAMAFGRAELPQDLADAEKVVKAWGRKLRCRMKELELAIRQVLGQDVIVDTQETGPKATVGEISLMLTAMTQTAPEIWEYQCSLTYVLSMLDTIIAQNAADGHSSKHDPRIKAERALGLVINAIRKRDKTPDG